MDWLNPRIWRNPKYRRLIISYTWINPCLVQRSAVISLGYCEEPVLITWNYTVLPLLADTALIFCFSISVNPSNIWVQLSVFYFQNPFAGSTTPVSSTNLSPPLLWYWNLFLFYLFIFTEVYLIYNIKLVSSIQHSDSVLLRIIFI